MGADSHARPHVHRPAHHRQRHNLSWHPAQPAYGIRYSFCAFAALALISHSLTDESCELFSRDVVVKLIRFSLSVRVFLSPRLFRRRLCRHLTDAEKKVFGLFLFQYFSGTAHSFSWTCWNSVT